MLRTIECRIAAKQMLGVGLCVWAATAAGQSAGDFPQRPMRMVVPYPPGGSTDNWHWHLSDRACGGQGAATP